MREGLDRRWLPVVFFACCLPLFLGLRNTDLGNDEAIYSYAVDSILETGDWMSPLSSPTRDIVFLEKPSLKFWIVALPIWAGLVPHDEFGMRVWDALFGGMAFLYTFLLGHRVGGPVCAMFAVLVLFTHEPLVFEHGLRSNNMEAALLLAYCGGVYHFARWAEKAGNNGAIHVAATTSYFFLGFMTKFVAALFLPVVLVLAALLVPSYRARLGASWRPWLLASICFAAAASPWFIYQYGEHGHQLWRTIFGVHVYERFTGALDPGHVRPWHFYVSELFEHLQRASATWWAIGGGALLLVEGIRGARPTVNLILLWIIVPTVLISLATSKIYHYYYPFLPPVAIAAGYAAARIWLLLVKWTAPLGRRLTFLESDWIRAPRGRRVATIVLVLAAAIALATLAAGPLKLEVAPNVWFRNHSLTRPLIVVAICTVWLAGFRGVLAALSLAALLVWIPSPLAAYPLTFEKIRSVRRPLGRLAECLRAVDDSRRGQGEAPRGIHTAVAREQFTHPPFYYLRGSRGWGRIDDDVVRDALYGSDPRPVVSDRQQMSEFLLRVPPPSGVIATVTVDRIAVALPGPYSRCAGVTSENR